MPSEQDLIGGLQNLHALAFCENDPLRRVLRRIEHGLHHKARTEDESRQPIPIGVEIPDWPRRNA